MSQQQYFTQYAEPEINYLVGFPDRKYSKVLCIPAYDENPDFLDSIQTAATFCSTDVLLILVVNQPEDVSHCERNNTLVRILNHYPCLWKNGNSLQLNQLETLDILLVDRYTPDKKIPRKKGVGLARKIACDLAASLFVNKHINEAQMYCSDADVIFPADYFSAQIPDNNSAAIFNFAHSNKSNDHSGTKVHDATLLYEKSLHHYVDGLKQAGSQYAYHTIGSCLLISTTHYIKVRGFPIRPAGEDFYLLNKLQKLAPVASLELPIINITSRLSDRVPFGTGPAIDKLINSGSPDTKIFYHPYCFVILGEWLLHLDQIAENHNGLSNKTSENTEITAYLLELETLFNLHSTMTKIFKTHKSTVSRKKHLHEWFDGFKTLKAVHYLRDNYFSSMSYTELQRYKLQ